MPMLTKLPNYLQLAKSASLCSNYKIKVGACIIRHGKIVGVGCNVNKTHPKSARLAATMHAEHSALSAANGTNLRGATVIIYRASKDGRPALAKPCTNCQRLLRAAGCKLMVYTTVEYPYFQVEKL